MPNPLRRRRARREAELDAATAFRAARRLVDEDVTVFGEDLTDLHVQTLTDTLTEPMLDDYQAALTTYDQAKAALVGATGSADVVGVEALLTDGRFLLARVLARRDGRALPERREPCYFNPQHGPASQDLAWTPPGGVEREVLVCFRCVQRLAQGEQPDHRLVRSGDRWVSWWEAGGTVATASGIDAHVVRGDAWLSRTHRAEAEIRGAASRFPWGGAGA